MFAQATSVAGLLTLVAGLLLTPPVARAQTPAAEVTAASARLYQALIAADSAALRQYTVPELSVGHANGQVQDRKDFIAAIAAGKPDYTAIETTGQTVQVLGNTSVVRHTILATMGDKGSIKMQVLMVFQKQRGRWLLLARQATKAGL